MWIWIAMGLLAIIILRILTRKRRNARKARRAEWRQQKRQVRYRARVKTRGTITPVKLCQEEHNGQRCGLPVSKCRTMRRDAEHAAGMLGPRKEK